uniref:hypothetical protein n=1 Tax=uncultured Altererythrobacter sp. TaxID=500840 RepID=UPI00261215DE|nr:hypothetical protein [uncultured Altererythrobacter sp.]
MSPKRSVVTLLAAAPLLSACVSTGGGPIIVPDGAAPRPEPTTQSPGTPPGTPASRSATRGAPQVMSGVGLEGVIGAGAAQLQRQFGNPQLDVREGDARKLQFAGEACVLDVFLYSDRAGATPTATHVEARRASDGRNVDRAACIRALRRR